MAKIIEDDDNLDDSVVGVGLKVKVKEMESGDVDEYVIVGATEADPFEGKISNVSPVGAALLGNKVGKMVHVDVDDGNTVTYKIMSISK